MIIFVLPGFGSHNPNRKFYVLKKYLPNAKVIGLSYPSNDPDEIFQSFSNSISAASTYHDDKDLIFLGTSLGGFWAQHLSKIFNGKSILINPALDPCTTLADHIGLNINSYTNDVTILTDEMVHNYMKYYQNGNLITSLVLLDRGDELIDSNTTLELSYSWVNSTSVIYSGGDHSFQHIKESLLPIKEFIKYDL